MHPDADRCRPSILQTVVELRLGEKRIGRLEYVVCTTQFLDLALQGFELLAFAGRQPFTLIVFDFITLDPVIERLRNAANLGGY